MALLLSNCRLCSRCLRHLPSRAWNASLFLSLNTRNVHSHAHVHALTALTALSLSHCPLTLVCTRSQAKLTAPTFPTVDKNTAKNATNLRKLCGLGESASLDDATLTAMAAHSPIDAVKTKAQELLDARAAPPVRDCACCDCAFGGAWRLAVLGVWRCFAPALAAMLL